MPKANGSVVAALLVVLALTGCSGAPAAGPTITVTAPADSDAGSTVQRNSAEDDAPALSAEDEVFLDYVHTELPPKTVLTDVPDEELIAIGHDACEQMLSGTPIEDLRLVDGEVPTDAGYFMDTSAIFNGAITAYCPDAVEYPES